MLKGFYLAQFLSKVIEYPCKHVDRGRGYVFSSVGEHGQTVGDMNKSYKTDPPKAGSLYPMSPKKFMVGGGTYRKLVFVFFWKTVCPTNKSYKTDPPNSRQLYPMS